MPKPPPRSISGRTTPSSLPIRACSASTRRAATSKPEESKIWLPMWECRPEQLEGRRLQDAAYGVVGLAVGDREAELLVLVGGGDVFVGVRLDARGHADHDLRGAAEPLGDLGEPLDLVEGVQDHPADAERDRALELGDALVVAVEADPRHVEPGPLGDRELAAGADVEARAPPRPPSARSRCRGRPCPRRRRRSRRTPRGTPGPGPGSPPRRGRTPGCRARPPGR